MTLRQTMTGNALALITASALFAGTAFAQTPTRFTEAEDDTMQVAPFGMTVDQIEDSALYTSDGTQVGEIENVLVDTAGTPVALVVEPQSGLQVEDDEDLVITIDQVNLGGGQLTTNLTEESLLRLPRWDD